MPKKKLKDSCDKCGNPIQMGGLYLVGGEIFVFCKGCDAILQSKGTGDMISRFIDGTLILTKEENAMIEARQDRNKGKRLWKKDN